MKYSSAFLFLGTVLGLLFLNAGCGGPSPGVREYWDGDPYYAGREAEKEGRLEEALALYRLQYDQGTGTLKDLEAAKSLLSGLLASGSFREAFRISTDALDKFAGDSELLSLYAEGCLALEKNRRALWAAHEAMDIHPGPTELLLLTEASRRMRLAPWRDRMLRLFLDYPVSEVHLRFLEYLSSPFGDRPGDSLKLLVAGKAALLSDRPEEALRYLKAYRDEGMPFSPLLIHEMGDLLRRGEDENGGILLFLEQLEVFGQTYPEDVRAAIHEEVARLYLSAGRHGEASVYLDSVRSSGELNDNTRRMLVTAFLGSSGLSAAMNALVDLLPSARNPAVLDGVLDEITASLVRSYRWKEIERLGSVVQACGTSAQGARYLYLIGRAVEEGYLPTRDTEVLFRTSAEKDPRGYYGFLAGRYLSGEEEPDYHRLLLSEEGGPSPSPVDDYVLTFFRRGMIDEGLAEAYSRLEKLSPHGASAVAAAAAEEGSYLDAVRIMLRWDARRNTPPDAKTLRMLYPRWFYPEISAAAERFGVPKHVFFGLVREESAFQPDILSRSGAVGLSQLMPSTAAWGADLMAYGPYEIADPVDNAMIGAWYLARMHSAYRSFSYALAAYNAGPGRVRQWAGEFGGLPADLFVEAIPVTETRRYVKKVLVSSVYYGYLYDAVHPTDTVHLWF